MFNSGDSNNTPRVERQSSGFSAMNAIGGSSSIYKNFPS